MCAPCVVASVAGWHTPPALRATPSTLEGELPVRVVPLRGTLALPSFSPGLAPGGAETWGFVSLCIFDARLSTPPLS